jgi:hypothetical protein
MSMTTDLNLHFDKSPTESFPTLLSRYKDKDLASPYRSTIPLLALLKDHPRVLADILTACGLSNSAKLHLEFTVRPEGGRGKASHTDLMVCSELSALAIEVKWTEPRYDDVSTWLRREQKQSDEQCESNRREVMKGWLSFLQKHCFTRNLEIQDFGDVVYQMVHRAASACSAAKGQRPQLGYLLFTPLPDRSETCPRAYVEDLARLRCQLGKPPEFDFHVFIVRADPTAAFRHVQNLEKGAASTGQAMKDALVREVLFDFSLDQVLTVH